MSWICRKYGGSPIKNSPTPPIEKKRKKTWKDENNGRSSESDSNHMKRNFSKKSRNLKRNVVKENSALEWGERARE